MPQKPNNNTFTPYNQSQQKQNNAPMMSQFVAQPYQNSNPVQPPAPKQEVDPGNFFANPEILNESNPFSSAFKGDTGATDSFQNNNQVKEQAKGGNNAMAGNMSYPDTGASTFF